MLLRHGFALLSLVLLGCAEVAPDDELTDESDIETTEADLTGACPTAKTGALSHFLWRTTRQLERVVWSSDGTQIGGVEYVFEEKKSWNPLDGTTQKRKFCHQLVTLDTKGKRFGTVGPMQPNQAGDITFMKPAGYFTTQSFVRDAGGWDFHRVALDGSRTLLAHVDVGCQYGRMLPSPDGSRIAYFEVRGHCDDGLSGNDVIVTFFDGKGKKLGTSSSISLPNGAYETWTPAGDLIVTDGVSSYRVDLAGSVVKTAPASVPSCMEPGTTSSNIASDGRTLDFDANGKAAVVSTDPSTAFGCQ